MKNLITYFLPFSILAGAFFNSSPSLSDEGMWTLNQFPSKQVKKLYDFEPNSTWLTHTQRASVRLARGCSGSLVSKNGLVLTNHHCAHACIEQNSKAGKDYVKDGFYAEDFGKELKCPDAEVNQLIEISDVTKTVLKATQSKKGKEFNDSLKAIFSSIEKDCSQNAASTRCDIVTLYQGGQYHLYKYRRFQDIRLVFAPEFDIAFFGGDPDNFTFPRYNLDIAFLRVYENEIPLKTDDTFKFSFEGPAVDDLVFVTGHPGRTSRFLSVSELKFHRDYLMPDNLTYLSELRGLLTEFQNRSDEAKRISNQRLFSIENSLKSLKGKHQALTRGNLFSSKEKAELKFQMKLKAQPKLWNQYHTSWNEIETALDSYRNFYQRYQRIEASNMGSNLLGFARTLIRSSQELKKPNEKRLREFTDSALPQLKQSLFSNAPIYDELEIISLTFSLTKLRELFSADDPLIKSLLGNRSPDQVATEIVKGSTLRSVENRKSLFDVDTSTLLKSKDSMIQFAAKIEPIAREIRTRYEDEVEGNLKQASEKIAKARFALEGTKSYPDATFTLRISYGQIKGLTELGRKVQPITTLGETFNRHSGSAPFNLPKSWIESKNKLNLETPFNFISTNDIIGGNSGSPVINQKHELVGVIFDGNIHSLGGDFGFDPTLNRAVSVHSAGIGETLEKIYSAKRLVNELKGELK